MNEGAVQAKFEGWAVVEMMGHQREIGFVTTEYFGGSALFRVDTPAIAEREYELKRPEFGSKEGRNCYAPAGSRVKRGALPAKSRLVSPGSLYAITPCTEATTLKAIDEVYPRPLIILEIKEEMASLPGEVAAICPACTDGDHDACDGDNLCVCDDRSHE